MKAKGIWLLIVLAGTCALAAGQAISVFVDGEPVKFPGIGPQRVGGRVLVPLRGVMEKLGAYVGYDPATRTVTATRGDVDLSLKIGERNAVVNGQAVTLDVPAQELRGSTLVPLRFMGEALGADVKWDNTTNTVNITTAGTPPSPEPNPIPTPGPVRIQSFEVDAPDYLRAGSRIDFTLTGTPRGAATVQIPGVAAVIALRETSFGVYQGSYTLPAVDAKPLTLSKASAIAALKVGSDEKLIQSGTPLRVDTVPPKIASITPEDRSRVNRLQPNVTAVFEDQGSGIDLSSVLVSVDRKDVTADATVTENLVVYRPEKNLESGTHTVTVSAKDRAGNAVARAWTFTIAADADVIRSFSHNAGADIQPGDEIEFTLVGEPKGRAAAAIGTKVRDITLSEVAPGKYVGTYVVRRSDRFTGEVATARFVTSSGEVFTADAAKPLGEKPIVKLAAPKFMAPKEGAGVPRRIVVTGTAQPKARVRLKIEFVQLALGALRTTGTVFEQELEVDEKGNWSTDEIDLDTGLGRSNITYTATAIAVGADDKESEPATVTFKR